MGTGIPKISTAKDSMTTFEHAVAATRGARDYQEDTAAFWPGGDNPFVRTTGAVWPADGSGLAVLADGMGGHAGGALASRMVCEEFISAAAAHGGSLDERLRAALEAANAAIAGKVAENPLLAGMGSTLIGASFSHHGIEWDANVGARILYKLCGTC